jgi:hypothetical protein
MATLHLFWFGGWNVVAIDDNNRAKLLGFKYTASRKIAEGLLAAQLRKYIREEGGVAEGGPLYMVGGDDAYLRRVPTGTKPYPFEQAPWFQND